VLCESIKWWIYFWDVRVENGIAMLGRHTTFSLSYLTQVVSQRYWVVSILLFFNVNIKQTIYEKPLNQLL
jgi:hypothetical protein